MKKQWHPLFVHLLRPLVETHFEVQTNVPVGDLPRLADTVLLRRRSAGALPYQGIWSNLTTWNVLEYKGRTVSPRVRQIDALAELGLGIDRRLNEERVRRGSRGLAPRDVSFWLISNRLGRRFLRDARLRLPGIEQLGAGIWRCELLQRMVFLVSSVHLVMEGDSLPLRLISEGSPEAAEGMAQLLVEQPLLWKQYGSWLRVLHPDVWNEVQDMARAARKKLEIDFRPVVDAILQDETGELTKAIPMSKILRILRKRLSEGQLTEADKRELKRLADQ